MGADLKSVFIQLKDKAIKKQRKCMFYDCSCDAIKYSHVFQKNKILNQFAQNGHLMIFDYGSDGEGKLRLKGINKAFTFKGFCQKHDNDLFASIEKDNPDWFNVRSQYLLGYKSICRELAIKQIAFEIGSEFIKCFAKESPIYRHYELTNTGVQQGILDFQLYKAYLEYDIINENFQKYKFTTIELPFKLEVCISTPLTNSYSDIPNEDIAKADLPEMNIVNIFPYQNKTFAIIGCINTYPNKWANSFIEKLKSGNKIIQLKAISDLIVYRCEFHCMSRSLYEIIGEKKLQQYYDLFQRNLCTMRDINIDFNLFENCFTNE